MRNVLRLLVVTTSIVSSITVGSVSAEDIPAWKKVVPDANRLGVLKHRYFPAEFNSGNYTHFGVDILGPRGTNILCGKDIHPLFDGEVVAKLRDGGRTTPGNAIMIRHPGKGRNGDDLYTVYLHLQEYPTITGHVSNTDIIGKIGKTGFANNVCHTHFEIRNFYNPSAAGGGWYHKNAHRCGSDSKNIYACGNVSNEQWAIDDWEDPETFMINDVKPYATSANIAWIPANTSCQHATKWFHIDNGVIDEDHPIADRTRQSVDGNALCIQYSVPGQCTVDFGLSY